jgi:hypothetical protein
MTEGGKRAGFDMAQTDQISSSVFFDSSSSSLFWQFFRLVFTKKELCPKPDNYFFFF